MRPARPPEVNAALFNLTQHADARAATDSGLRRRVWDLIPLGFEVQMLWLHLHLSLIHISEPRDS